MADPARSSPPTDLPPTRSEPGGLVLYPVFAKLAEHTEDDGWKAYLLRFSQGIFSLRLYYHDGVLRCLGRRKCAPLQLTEEMTSAEDCHRVLDFFRRGGLYSKEERQAALRRFEERQREYREKLHARTWGDIKQPLERKCLLGGWMDWYDRKQGLTTQERSRLEAAVNEAERHRYFTQETVRMANGLITDVGVQVTVAERGDRSFRFPYDPARLLPPRPPARERRREARPSGRSAHPGRRARGPLGLQPDTRPVTRPAVSLQPTFPEDDDDL